MVIVLNGPRRITSENAVGHLHTRACACLGERNSVRARFMPHKHVPNRDLSVHSNNKCGDFADDYLLVGKRAILLIQVISKLSNRHWLSYDCAKQDLDDGGNYSFLRRILRTKYSA